MIRSRRTIPPPATSAEASTDAVLAEAANWYAQLRDGRASAQQQQRWQEWLQAQPQHRHAWQQVQAISGSFMPIRQLPNAENTAEQLEATSQRIRAITRRRLLLGMATVVGVGSVGWVVWGDERVPAVVMAWQAEQRTGIGERRSITLADGGTLWLNTDTAIDVDYRAGLRRIVLYRGEILVETAADAQNRPFVIDSPHGRLRAIGTRFGVHLHERATELTVLDGRVAIHTVGHQTAMLGAGQYTRFTAERIEAAQATDASAQAWTQGVLVAHDMPLGEVIAELRRYRHGQIVLAPGLETLRVYGSFPLDDTDRALAMIAQVLKLHLRRRLPWRVSVEPG